jgi:PEP-CTERM motif-containing protein
LLTLDPATGGVLTSVPTADFLGALGIRPTDGTIFGGSGDTGNIFTVDAATGAETLVGNTGLRFAGDLDFRVTPVPEPGTSALIATGLLFGLRWRAKRSDKKA